MATKSEPDPASRLAFKRCATCSYYRPSLKGCEYPHRQSLITYFVSNPDTECPVRLDG